MIRDFEYLAPKTVVEALKLLAKYKDDCKIIAGGQSLLTLMKQGLLSPQYLIDIKGLTELEYIKPRSNDGLMIGALTTHRAIETSSLIKEKLGVLAEMERRLASPQTRNWGTIGGNLCQADPAGDPAPLLIALGAEVKITSAAGERVVPLEDFFVDYYETVLQSDEMLTEIRVPSPAPHTGVSYAKFVLSESEPPIVGVAVALAMDSENGTCKNARVVLGGAAAVPLRAKEAEGFLVGKVITDDVLEKAGQMASGEASPIPDVHASAEYRSELVKVFVKRIGKEALAKAQNA